MRAIKCRQWINGKWHYWGLNENGLWLGSPMTLNEPSEEFTGFLDCDKKEIYEGDKIETNYTTRTVVFRKGKFQALYWIAADPDDYKAGYEDYFDLCDLKHMKIIGNIHEKAPSQ